MNVWRKPMITLGGGIVVLAGVVMLVTPGPGLLAIAAGVAIWATEYTWAERLLRRVRAKISELKAKKAKPNNDKTGQV